MTAFLAATHYLAIGLGYSGLLLRMLEFKYVTANSPVRRIIIGDNLWGAAFFLWLVTGILRAFFGFEKGSAYYLQNHWFWLKMTLFVIIFLIELKPMITLIKWRLQKKQTIQAEDLKITRKLYILSHIELGLLAFIPFIASIMARSGL